MDLLYYCCQGKLPLVTDLSLQMGQSPHAGSGQWQGEAHSVGEASIEQVGKHPKWAGRKQRRLPFAGVLYEWQLP